jgi:hypothetical protein
MTTSIALIAWGPIAKGLRCNGVARPTIELKAEIAIGLPGGVRRLYDKRGICERRFMLCDLGDYVLGLAF